MLVFTYCVTRYVFFSLEFSLKFAVFFSFDFIGHIFLYDLSKISQVIFCLTRVNVMCVNNRDNN